LQRKAAQDQCEPEDNQPMTMMTMTMTMCGPRDVDDESRYTEPLPVHSTTSAQLVPHVTTATTDDSSTSLYHSRQCCVILRPPL